MGSADPVEGHPINLRTMSGCGNNTEQTSRSQRAQSQNAALIVELVRQVTIKIGSRTCTRVCMYSCNSDTYMESPHV